MATVDTVKKRGRKPGVAHPNCGSMTDTIYRLPVGKCAYFEFDIDKTSAASFQSSIAVVISREIKKHDPSRKFVTGVFTAIPAKIGSPVKYVVRIERVL